MVHCNWVETWEPDFMARNLSHDELKPGHKVVISQGDYFNQEGYITEIRGDRMALVSIGQHSVSASCVQ